MVKAWYIDDEKTDQRLEHHRNPPELVSLHNLFEKTGVEYLKLNINTFDTDGVLDDFKKKRGYNYEDEITFSKEGLKNYEEQLAAFYAEHLHADEEIRLVLEGSGYFDVRDSSDQWIRIAVTVGDMLVLPGGIYHRFTLDFSNYLKLKRLFTEEPVWVSYNRPVDDMACRKEYVDKLSKGFVAQACRTDPLLILWHDETKTTLLR